MSEEDRQDAEHEPVSHPDGSNRFAAAGRMWTVVVDVPLAKRLKHELGIDLLKCLSGDASPLEQLLDNPITLVDALWVACAAQAESHGVSDEEFGRGLVGPGLDQAVDALMVAIANFFPRGRREIVRGVVAGIQQAHQRMATRLIESLERPEMAEALEQHMERSYQDALRKLTGGS